MSAVCDTLVRFMEFHENIELILQRLIGKSVKVWLLENKKRFKSTLCTHFVHFNRGEMILSSSLEGKY